MAKSIKVTENTHARLTGIAKWGQSLDSVIVTLLDSEELTRVGNLNGNEKKAYRWLLDQDIPAAIISRGYSKKERAGMPDFKVEDTNGYEVKTLIKAKVGKGQYINFGSAQTKVFEQINPVILVFSTDSEEPIIICPYSEIKNEAQNLGIVVTTQDYC